MYNIEKISQKRNNFFLKIKEKQNVTLFYNLPGILMKSIENKSMAYSKSIDTENRASIKCVTRTTLYQLVI